MSNQPNRDGDALKSINPALLWPGRAVIRAEELAKALAVDRRHILNLVEAGELEAVNAASSHSSRKWIRIPISAVVKWLAGRIE